METEIKGKVVAITGASSGIGEAIAVMLAAKGARVVLAARRADKIKALAEQITASGGQATYAATDVTNREDMTKLVELACDQYGKLDVMVNNAGIAHLSRIDELHVAEWEAMIDVNLKGVLYGIAAAIPAFKKQGSGHIINIISTSGIKIVPTQGVYAGTKNAVRTITEALRQEAGTSMRVTGISPGMVRTALTSHNNNPEMKEAISNMHKIAISPDAIARAVVYAISQPPEVEVGDIVVRPTAQG